MIKKLITTGFVLIVAFLVACKFNFTQKENIPTTSAPSFANDVISALNKQKAKSVVILALNNPADVRNADRTIAALEETNIKLLTYEIYDKKTSVERLLEVAKAKGIPEVFCVNGKLISPAEFDNFITQELSGKKINKTKAKPVSQK